MTNAEFYGTNGALVNINLQADGNISVGKKEGIIKSQVFTETNGHQVKWEDMSFSISVNDGGSSVTSNLGVSDIELKVGYTQEMAINLNNGTKKYVAFQFDIALPEGITIAKNDRGKLMASLNRDRIDDHTLNVQDLGSGSYRFLCFSMTNAEFYGTSGPLVNLTLQASENLSSGERTATIKNQVFTEVSSDQVKWDDLSFKITTPIPVVPKITADNKSRMYGDENPVFTYTTNETLNGEPELVTTATKISPVGEYEIVVRKGTLKGDFIANNGILTISKAPLTITAKSYTMKQGDALPAFDVTYSGFKNDENKEVLTKQPTFSCEATSATAPGTYDIVVSNTEADNYDISYVKGTLTIIEADPVKVTAKSYTREYGNDNPTFEYSVEGASLEGTPEIICEATTTSPVGEYPIVIKKGSVKNYNDTYINGVLTITKATLTISVGDYEKKQYDPMPEFVPDFEDFKNGETKDVLRKQPTVNCEANEESTPGEYAIVVKGAEAENYEIKYVSGKLTVTEPDSYTLTYMVDGEIYQSFSVKYRDSITPLEVPSKEGYTFSGWSEIPTAMPAKDVTVTGSFTINSYTLTYQVDGTEYKTLSVEYGASITPEAEPVKEGYTFSGWSEIPTTMPAKDVVVTGTFTINSYTLTYQVDGTENKKLTVEYGASITPEAEPTKEGYTFSGWSEIPTTMPAKDVTVTGTFTINSYTLTYQVDGTEYKKLTVEYGASITPEAEPVKEGYTFSGWSEIPNTMPAKDVTVTGSFSINSYTLTYQVDGTEHKKLTVEYGATITPEVEPVKEGYTFSGWSEIPTTMPAKDVTVTGSFTVNSYTLTYIVDGEVYKTSSIVYGTSLTPEVAPTKEGYTFSGWSEIPTAMPAKDVVVTGTFTINSYTLTYQVDGTEYKKLTVEYGATITPEVEPTKEGYTFSGWSEIPTTMPAKDVTVTGSFTVNSYTLTYMVDGEEYQSFSVKYMAPITPLDAPQKEGYTFSGWDGLPRSMPAKDIVVKGFFTINSYTITYVLDGETYTTETLEYGAKIVPPVISGLEDYTIWEDVPETMPAKDITIYGKAKDIIDGLTPMFSNGKGEVFDLNGRKLSAPQKGINIIRMSDGTSRKVLIR